MLKNKGNKAFVPVIFPNGFLQNYNLPIMLKTKVNKIPFQKFMIKKTIDKLSKHN